MHQDDAKKEINALRGGTMGVVSGSKGGALAGAIGGLVLIYVSTAGMGFNVYSLFVVILGATFGGAAGAIVGGIQGVLSGVASGYLLANLNADQYLWIWLLLGGLSGGGVGAIVLADGPGQAAVVGTLLGVTAGFIGYRDFSKIVALQTADEDREA